MEKKITKRALKESNETRGLAYLQLSEVELNDHRLLGNTAEGLVYYNDDTELSIVVKVIVKALDFDGIFEVEDYAREQELKAKALEEKEIKKQAKILKDKAKAEKTEIVPPTEKTE